MKSVMENEQLDVAGFEFVTDEAAKHYFYDINTNTNYNTDAENRCGKFAMERLAEYLGAEFSAHYGNKLIMAGQKFLLVIIFEFLEYVFLRSVSYKQQLRNYFAR